MRKVEAQEKCGGRGIPFKVSDRKAKFCPASAFLPARVGTASGFLFPRRGSCDLGLPSVFRSKEPTPTPGFAKDFPRSARSSSEPRTVRKDLTNF